MPETENVVVTLDKVREVMGDDADEFINVMNMVNDMILNTEKYHGTKALIAATKLAAYRTKISMKAQFYKTSKPSPGLDQLTIRRRKDVLLSMYTSLEENINALKLMGRVDATAAGIIK